jgi:signal transduction histidine kinase
MEENIIISITIATLLFLLMICFMIAFWMIYRRKRAAHVVEKEQLKAAFEKEILLSQLEIREQTLKNISQEIHDNIGQVLSLIKLTISSIETAEDESLAEKVTNSRLLISKVIQDLRDLSKSMDTDMIAEKGLFAAISSELEMIKKTGAYDVTMVTEGTVSRMESSRELILFRIFQEVMNNVMKHANATEVRVNIVFAVTLSSLEIRDNGCGFDIPLTLSSPGKGMGLRNMNTRSVMIGATFSIENNVPSGTITRIQFTK